MVWRIRRSRSPSRPTAARPGTLKLGNKNATQGEIYALKNDEKRVFLVSSFQETSFNRKPFDLRDKKILKFDRDKADSLVLVKGAQTRSRCRGRAASGRS